MACHWLGDQGAAQEALQDCFLRIWNRAGDYSQDRGKPFSWCAMILRGLCLDHLRKRRRRIGSAGDAASADFLATPDDPHGVKDLYFQETIARVRGALDQLDASESESIRAALFDPLSIGEHAVRWGIPLGTTKVRVHHSVEVSKPIPAPGRAAISSPAEGRERIPSPAGPARERQPLAERERLRRELAQLREAIQNELGIDQPGWSPRITALSAPGATPVDPDISKNRLMAVLTGALRGLLEGGDASLVIEGLLPPPEGASYVLLGSSGSRPSTTLATNIGFWDGDGLGSGSVISLGDLMAGGSTNFSPVQVNERGTTEAVIITGGNCRAIVWLVDLWRGRF